MHEECGRVNSLLSKIIRKDLKEYLDYNKSNHLF